MQIANKLDELSKKQDSLSKVTALKLNEQQEVKEAFKKLEKDLQELQKDN